MRANNTVRVGAVNGTLAASPGVLITGDAAAAQGDARFVFFGVDTVECE